MSLSNFVLDDVTNRFASLQVSEINIPNPEIHLQNQPAKLSQLPEDIIGEIFARSLPQEHASLERASKMMLSIGRRYCSISTACKRVPLHRSFYASLNARLKNEPEVVLAYLSEYLDTRYQGLPDELKESTLIVREALLHDPRVYFSLSEAYQRRFDYFMFAQIGCEVCVLKRPLSIREKMRSGRSLFERSPFSKAMDERKKEIEKIYFSKINMHLQSAVENLSSFIECFVSIVAPKLVVAQVSNVHSKKSWLNELCNYECDITLVKEEIDFLRVYNQLAPSPFLILKHLSTDPQCITLNSQLLGDKSLALRAVQENGLVLQYLSEDFKKSRLIVAEAVHQNPDALQFASLELQQDQRLKALADERKTLMSQTKNAESLKFDLDYL